MYYTCLQMRNEVQRREQPQGHPPAGDRGDVGTQLNTTPCHQGSWSFGRERHVQLSSPTTLPSPDPASSGEEQVEAQCISVHAQQGPHWHWPCHLLKCGQISHSTAAETPFSFHSDSHSLHHISTSLRWCWSGCGHCWAGGSYGETELGIRVVWAWGKCMWLAVTTLCHVLHVQTEG